MNDIIIGIGKLAMMSGFFICSEDVLEWAGIPNQEGSGAKNRYYDEPMHRRSEASRNVVALTTPFIMSGVMRILASILVTDYFGAVTLWMYILYVYYSRNIVYDVSIAGPEYAMFNWSIFGLTLLSWKPDDAMFNILNASWYIGVCVGIRVFTTFFTASSSVAASHGFPRVPTVQHVLWDPMLSFLILRKNIQDIRKFVSDAINDIIPHAKEFYTVYFVGEVPGHHDD